MSGFDIIESMKKRCIIFLFIFLISLCSISNFGMFVKADETDEFLEVETSIENFDEYNSISIYSNQILLTAENKVTSIANGQVINFNNIGGENGQIYQPKFAKKLKDNSILIYDGLNRVQIYNEQFQFLKLFDKINAGSKFYNLGIVSSLATDYLGNVYMADATNNKILKIDVDGTYIEEVALTTTAQISNRTKLAINANGTKLALFVETTDGNEIFVYNLSNNLELAKFSTTKFLGMMFDCTDNLFTYDTSKINKYLNTDFSLSNTKTLAQNAKSVDINLEDGTFFCLGNKIYSFKAENFASNANNQVAPINIKSTTLNQSKAKICINNASCKLFKTPVSFSSSNILPDNSKVVVLKEDIEQNLNMSFVLTNISGTEVEGYVEKQYLTPYTFEFEQATYKTICQNVPVLTYPTKNAGISKTIDAESTALTVVGNATTYCDFAGNQYYEVETENGIGYVNQKYLTKTGEFESAPTEFTPTSDFTTKFIAYNLIIVCLLVVTIFVTLLIIKKTKNNKNEK